MGEGDSETMSPESKGGSGSIASTPASKAVPKRIKTKTPESDLSSLRKSPRKNSKKSQRTSPRKRKEVDYNLAHFRISPSTPSTTKKAKTTVKDADRRDLAIALHGHINRCVAIHQENKKLEAVLAERKAKKIKSCRRL